MCVQGEWFLGCRRTVGDGACVYIFLEMQAVSVVLFWCFCGSTTALGLFWSSWARVVEAEQTLASQWPGLMWRPQSMETLKLSPAPSAVIDIARARRAVQVGSCELSANVREVVAGNVAWPA